MGKTFAPELANYKRHRFFLVNDVDREHRVGFQSSSMGS